MSKDKRTHRNRGILAFNSYIVGSVHLQSVKYFHPINKLLLLQRFCLKPMIKFWFAFTTTSFAMQQNILLEGKLGDQAHMNFTIIVWLCFGQFQFFLWSCGCLSCQILGLKEVNILCLVNYFVFQILGISNKCKK